jgi:ADP-heptose:LPS heptosyltransferase
VTAIVLAPFSNSALRDWPAMHFAALARLLIERTDGAIPIRVFGTQAQRLRANQIVRGLRADLVSNDCGRLPWSSVEAELAAARCVIGNNSGIAHISANLGTPTVCIFGGSHQRLEWRPLGPSVVTVSNVIACSPCHADHRGRCDYGLSCLREIAPETIADVVCDILCVPVA